MSRIKVKAGDADALGRLHSTGNAALDEGKAQVRPPSYLPSPSRPTHALALALLPLPLSLLPSCPCPLALSLLPSPSCPRPCPPYAPPVPRARTQLVRDCGVARTHTLTEADPLPDELIRCVRLLAVNQMEVRTCRADAKDGDPRPAH